MRTSSPGAIVFGLIVLVNLVGTVLHLLDIPYRDIFHILSRSRGIAMPDTAAQVEYVERFARAAKCGVRPLSRD